MEGELWARAYRVVREEASRRSPGGRVTFADMEVVLMLVWSALHDRPVGWAREPGSWAGCPRP